jgi:1,4-alpha-glucan branching enzyme
MAHPGKKLMFMGGEFGQFIEWNYQQQLDWQLLDYPAHKQCQNYVRDLNAFYLKHEQFWEAENSWDGFQWIIPDDNTQNIVAFMRKNLAGKEMIAISNFSTVTREHYRIGVPYEGKYTEAFSSNAVCYGGDGVRNEPLHSDPIPCHGFDYSMELTIPAMSTLFFTFRKTPKTAIKKAEKSALPEAIAE